VSVAFYMDENVPAAITQGLRDRGVDVRTVQEDGCDGTADPQVLDRAGELGRVVFTRDQDFLVEATRRQRSNETFAGIVYAHQLRVPVAQCIADLELLGGAADPHDLADRVQHLPLR
jgi:hypothetical protein